MQKDKPDQAQNLNWIGRLIHKKTFSIHILIAIIFGMAVFACLRIPIEVMPRESTPAFLFLRVDGPENSSPEKVEMALTIPLEGIVRTLPGLVDYSSSTNSRGTSVSLTYKAKTNLDLAVFNLQEALQELESHQILDMKRVDISRLNPDANAVLKLSITHDNNIKNPVSLIKDDLRIRLESVAEISKIEVIGLDPIIYEYEVPLARVNQFGMSGPEFTARLNFQNFRESIGEAALGSHDFVSAIKARQITSDLSQIRSHSLAKDSALNLSELSQERVVDTARTQLVHKNGEDAVFIEVFNKDSANLFELNEHLKSLMEKIKSENSSLSHLKFEVIYDKTDDLRQAVGEVFKSLFEAMLITFVVVFLFLRKLKQTILISIAIPISLMLTILLLFAKGESLNILTLSGLILAIGMVIDNAVLIVGRIEELKHKSKRVLAVGEAASDVSNALLMATLTNAIIFLPVAFLESGDSFTDLLKAFQIPILCSLGSSLLVALFIIPILSISFRKTGYIAKDTRPVRPPERVIQFFRAIRKRKKPIAVCVLAFVTLTAYKIVDINQTDLESPKDGFTTVFLKFTPEVPEAQRLKIFSDCEKILLANQSEVRFSFVVSDFNSHFLQGSFLVYPKSGRDIDQVIAAQQGRLESVLQKFPKFAGFSSQMGEIGGVQTKARRSQIFNISGPKTARLMVLEEELKKRFEKVKGVDSVKLDREENGNRDLVFIPADVLVAQFEMSLSEIAKEISASMGSVSVSNLNLNGQVVAAKISLEPSGGEWALEDFKNLRVTNKNHQSIRVDDLGKIMPMSFIRSIGRQAGTSKLRIVSYFDEALSDQEFQNARSELNRVFGRFEFPKGYGPPRDESKKHIEDMQNKSNFIILLSALLIYLLLASMFESFLIPFAILFTVPLAIIFGCAGLYLMKMDLDVMARLSLVILVGIGVNGAIILIDLILHLKAQGYKREEAVVIGCARRLKAVLMSASIQIISVLPVALGQSKLMGIPYASLGVSIISGMLFSTLITLVILPMAFEFLDELEERIKDFFVDPSVEGEAFSKANKF